MATKKVELVEIKPIEEAIVHIRVVGDTPLVTHCWDVKAQRKILAKELGLTVNKRDEAKNPNADFCSSLYWLTPMPEEFSDDAVETNEQQEQVTDASGGSSNNAAIFGGRNNTTNTTFTLFRISTFCASWLGV